MKVMDQTYMQYVLASQAEEEESIYTIREWYEGRQFEDGLGKREKYVAPVLAQLLREYPILNLVERTVRVLNERIRVDYPFSSDENLDAIIKNWWDSNLFGGKQADLYEAVLRDKSAVMIAEWDYERGIPKATVNELWDGAGGSCRVHYDGDGDIDFVSKRWVEVNFLGKPTGKIRVTLYFDDRIERWYLESGTSRMMTDQEVSAELGYKEKNPQPWLDRSGEPLGSAAIVFHNKNAVSECANVISAQAGMNEAILDWHTSARYHGIPTVLFEGVSFRIDPTTGREVEPEWSPGKGIAFDSGKVSRLQPVDMSTLFDGAVMPWIKIVSLQKGWPMHVFTQMPPSGETLRQMESPLVIQCDDRKEEFNDSWMRLFKLFMRMSDVATGVKVEGEFNFKWKLSVSLNELYEARVAQTDERAKKLKNDRLKLSQRQLLIESGYSEEDADRIIKERDEEAEKELNRKIRLELSKQAQQFSEQNGQVDSVDTSQDDSAPKNQTGKQSSPDVPNKNLVKDLSAKEPAAKVAVSGNA